MTEADSLEHSVTDLKTNYTFIHKQKGVSDFSFMKE